MDVLWAHRGQRLAGKPSAGNRFFPDLLKPKPVGSQTLRLVLATLQRPRFEPLMMEKTCSDGLSRIMNRHQQRWETKKMKYKISLTSVHLSVLADFCTPMKSHLGEEPGTTCARRRAGTTWLTTNSAACNTSPGMELICKQTPTARRTAECQVQGLIFLQTRLQMKK